MLSDVWARTSEFQFLFSTEVSFLQSGKGERSLQKVRFLQLCPDTHAFKLFGDVLLHLEDHLTEAGRRELINYNIYITRGWSANQALAIEIHYEDERNAITVLE